MILLYDHTHIPGSFCVVTVSITEQDVKILHIEVGTIWKFNVLYYAMHASSVNKISKWLFVLFLTHLK